jgi:hypothetical protein
MVHETTCGLSFQLTKGGIDDGIEDWLSNKKFLQQQTSSMPDGQNFPNGQLQSVDDKLWKNYGSISLS